MLKSSTQKIFNLDEKRIKNVNENENKLDFFLSKSKVFSSLKLDENNKNREKTLLQ